MPDGAWLGLHATVDIGGRCKFGPDIEWTPGIDYSFQPEKLEKFLDFIRSYYPGLEVERLHPDYTGVRPKLYREGEPVPDFAIHGPATHGVGPRRPLRHREPGADGVAGHRRGGGGDAGVAKLNLRAHLRARYLSAASAAVAPAPMAPVKPPAPANDEAR